MTVLSLSHCNELPSRIEVESSINRTIDEVEKLIRRNSTLPQLNRRDIVDLLFNITSKELEAYRDKGAIEEARKIYQRALLVVLPYNADDAKGNIDDLYTKPPIMKIIADPSANPEDLKAWRRKKLEPYTPAEHRVGESLENLVVTHDNPTKATKTRYKNHKDTYSEVRTKLPSKEAVKFDSEPIKFTFNLENLQRQSTIGRPENNSRRPVYRRPSLRNENVSVVYDTGATTRPRATTLTITSDDENRQTPTPPAAAAAAPPRRNGSVLSVDQWRYNAPTSATRDATASAKPSDSPPSSVAVREKFLPTEMSSEDRSTTPRAINESDKDSARILKVTSGKMRVADTERSAIYVTPIASSSSSPLSPPPLSFTEKPKYSSSYNLNSGGFRTITTTTMRPEVMEVLAFIGLRPENTTNVEEVFKKSKVNLEISSQIADSGGIVHTDTSGLTAGNSPSVIAQNAFGNSVSEIGKGMSNLTPDVQLLFQRFGLHVSGNMAATAASTSTPRSTTNTYTNFKPLPMSKINDQDMREFLARFGLGISDGNRRKKSMPASTERPSLIEAVPRDMRRILENIGLISRTTPRTTTTTTTTTTAARKTEDDVKPTTELASSMFHVFKPHEVHVKDERQRMMIHELLDTIRLVQEGKANATDVRRVADELLATTKTLREGPDPLSLEEIIRIYNEDVKNEVKRQNDPSDTTSATTVNGDTDVANATSTLTGIKKLMISILGTSEIWVGRIIHGLERIRRMLTNMGNRTGRSPSD